jgi:hypothetical protein
MNQSIEIKRNKFSFVTKERHVNASNLISHNSLKRSTAKMSLKFNDITTASENQHTNGYSIVSTAEEHIQTHLTLMPHFQSNPKLTSSIISFKSSLTADKSITFNVDFASTPKKILQRSSTPKQQLMPKRQSKKPKLIVKVIPPPLLTSSFRSVQKQHYLTKRKVCQSNMKKQNKRVKLQINDDSSKKVFNFPIQYLNAKTKDIDRNNLSQNLLFSDYKLWIV